jgi:hypothetical protein
MENMTPALLTQQHHARLPFGFRLFRGCLLLALAQCSLLAGDWTRGDTAAEAGYLALHCADWIQTLQLTDATHPEWHECNPILGRKTSRACVNNYFLLTGLAHVAIAKAIPKRGRGAFQAITIGIEIHCIENNFGLGVSLKF